MSNLSLPIDVFYSYADDDELLCKELNKHLSLLHIEGYITLWNKGLITAGMNWSEVIDQHIKKASVILLLISANFMNYNYQDIRRSIEIKNAREVKVIPILLSPVDWQGTQLKELQVLPHNGIPITTWHNQDQAFYEVVLGIREILNIPHKDADHVQTIQEALVHGDYEVAIQRITLVKSFSDNISLHEKAKLEYLEALVCLQGKLPRVNKLSVIETVEQHLARAIRYHNLYSYTYLLAIISDDFYGFNGFYWQEREVNKLMSKAQGIVQVLEDQANLKLLSYVQPTLFEKYFEARYNP